LASDLRYFPAPEEPVSAFGGMHTRSPAMREVFTVLERLARTDLTITLVGETGSGKSRLAQNVHRASARAAAPWVVMDRGSAVGEGAETRLLGCDRNLGPGLHSELPGLFEEAQSGTLFIEEVTELSPELQSLIVSILSSRRLRRVAGVRDIPIDVRVIATSKLELDTALAAGRLRQDLYFRLTTAVVRVPALRARREDFALLVTALLTDLGRGRASITPDALARLQTRNWLGNVRELKNTLALAFALSDGDELGLCDLERMGFGAELSVETAPSLAGITLERLEQIAIKQTLARVRGNKVHAAKMLGIAVSTLYEKLKRFSIA
jgi:DNA-binding NtrC family response regulator